MGKLEIVESIIDLVLKTGEKVASNDRIKNFVCGKYADGRPRSLFDAMDGEFLSPKQKHKFEKDSHKKKKRKSVKFKL